MTTQIALDQTTGDLTLHTGRDNGIRSMVGHDLTLRVGQWSSQVTLDDAGAVSNIRLVAALRSLEVDLGATNWVVGARPAFGLAVVTCSAWRGCTSFGA